MKKKTKQRKKATKGSFLWDYADHVASLAQGRSTHWFL